MGSLFRIKLVTDKSAKDEESLASLMEKFGDDEVARETEWGPAKGGGASFCTRKLVEESKNVVVFKPTLGARLFSLVFLIFGVGIIVLGVIEFELLLVLFGVVFGAAGGWLVYMMWRPLVFDKYSGYFLKGRAAGKGAEVLAAKGTSLEEVYAIQLISELVRKSSSSGSGRRSYRSYEINLVLKDGSRVNVVDHGKRWRIVDDAKRLGLFLEVPVWDATAVGRGSLE